MNVAILPAIAIHPAVERWAIKTSVPAGAYTKNATWVGLAGRLREGSMVWTTGRYPPSGKGGQKATTLWEIHSAVYEVLR